MSIAPYSILRWARCITALPLSLFTWLPILLTMKTCKAFNYIWGSSMMASRQLCFRQQTEETELRTLAGWVASTASLFQLRQHERQRVVSYWVLLVRFYALSKAAQCAGCSPALGLWPFPSEQQCSVSLWVDALPYAVGCYFVPFLGCARSEGTAECLALLWLLLKSC